jgi:hypothetical protein
MYFRDGPGLTPGLLLYGRPRNVTAPGGETDGS